MDDAHKWLKLNHPNLPYCVEINDTDDCDRAFVWCLRRYYQDRNFNYFKHRSIFLFASAKDASFVQLKWG